MKNLARWVGWIVVWLLFALFNLLLMTNRIEELVKLTLYSLLPIWILTVIGGSVEVAALLRQRRGGNLAVKTRNEGDHNG